MADQFNILDSAVVDWASNVTSGEETVPRLNVVQNNTAMTSQLLRLVYVTAKKTETISQVKMWSGAVAAGATPSLIRVGIWTADNDGALLSQVGATPNDTALLVGTFASYTKALSASFTKQRGQRYGVGLLVVTAATAPQVMSGSGNLLNLMMATSPRIAAQVAAQGDLPASLAVGSLAASGNPLYFELLP